MSEQINIRGSLSKNNVDYYIKTVNRMSSSNFSGGTRRGRTGSFGENMDLNYEYIFYVNKKDYDAAKHVINK